MRWHGLLQAEMLEEDARGVLEALVMRQMTNIRQDVDVCPAPTCLTFVTPGMGVTRSRSPQIAVIGKEASALL